MLRCVMTCPYCSGTLSLDLDRSEIVFNPDTANQGPCPHLVYAYGCAADGAWRHQAFDDIIPPDEPNPLLESLEKLKADYPKGTQTGRNVRRALRAAWRDHWRNRDHSMYVEQAVEEVIFYCAMGGIERLPFTPSVDVDDDYKGDSEVDRSLGAVFSRAPATFVREVTEHVKAEQRESRGGDRAAVPRNKKGV